MARAHMLVWQWFLIAVTTKANTHVTSIPCQARVEYYIHDKHAKHTVEREASLARPRRLAGYSLHFICRSNDITVTQNT